MDIKDSWTIIESWLSRNHPKSLERLRAPASLEQIAEVEKTTGIAFPESLKQFYRLHNGEQHPWPDGLFGESQWFLPTDEVIRIWKQFKGKGNDQGGEENWAFWKKSIEDTIICVDGPVKPLSMSRRRLPLAESEQELLFLDFDAPPGGTAGQVIRIYLEGCEFSVLAPSFDAFLADFAEDLAQGKYIVSDGCLEPKEPVQPKWRMPAFLAAVEYEQITAEDITQPVDIAALGKGGLVELTGDMGTLSSLENEVFFSLVVKDREEYWFLATPELTRGWDSVAARQYARVKARKYNHETSPEHKDLLGSAPDFIALEYQMLQGPEGLVTPPGATWKRGFRLFQFLLHLIYLLTIGLVKALFNGVRKIIRPPETIHLTDDVNPTWVEDERTSAFISELRSKGFEAGRAYTVNEMPGLHLLSLFERNYQFTAVLYKFRKKMWVDVVAKSNAGLDLTVTNNPFKMATDVPPSVQKIQLRDKPLSKLLDEIIPLCDGHELIAINDDTFKSVFETSYRQEMQWHNRDRKEH